jgi:hypothetical protein
MTMTDETGRDAWRRALAAAAKAVRNRRGQRPRGLATVIRAGMVWIQPTQDGPQRDDVKPRPGPVSS